MDITTKQIKDLRDSTGVSIMQCRNALEEALGDMEKAKAVLQKVSRKSAEKKAGRDLGGGIVVSYIHNNGTVGVLLELLCETDFVAKNDEFKALGRDIAMHIAAMNPENKDELLVQEFIKDNALSIKNLLEQATQKFGERTDIGQFTRFSIK
ncbi:MAG: elongation factor Ts [Patescibacteria group bacterium]